MFLLLSNKKYKLFKITQELNVVPAHHNFLIVSIYKYHESRVKISILQLNSVDCKIPE